ncbi:hypothetical protein FPV67DRAFT_1081750 [Lyophyllum atratum]|nr:hypothetical protein FPV67DRAFT_1081750 [Lyophyllum atratum]
MALPTFPPIPQYDHQHPVSSDRLHPLHHQRPYQEQPQNKKPRLDYSLNVNTSHLSRHGEHGHPLSSTSSDESMQRPSGNHGLGDESVYMYPQSSQQFHHPHRVPSDSSNHQHHHHQHHSQYPQYNAPYPPSSPPNHHGHGQGYNQSSFNAPHSDFSLGPQISSWGRTHGSNNPGNAGSTTGGALSFYSGPGMGPGGYDGMSESPFSRGDDNRDNGSGDKAGRDSFANAFLEAEQQRKVTLPQSGLSLSRASTSAASFGLDWPTHVRAPAPTQQATPPPPPIAAPPPAEVAAQKSDAPAEDGGSAAPDPGGVGWLDLLSSSTPSTAVPPSSEATMPSPRSGSAETLESGA